MKSLLSAKVLFLSLVILATQSASAGGVRPSPNKPGLPAAGGRVDNTGAGGGKKPAATDPAPTIGIPVMLPMVQHNGEACPHCGAKE